MANSFLKIFAMKNRLKALSILGWSTFRSGVKYFFSFIFPEIYSEHVILLRYEVFRNIKFEFRPCPLHPWAA